MLIFNNRCKIKKREEEEKKKEREEEKSVLFLLVLYIFYVDTIIAFNTCTPTFLKWYFFRFTYLVIVTHSLYWSGQYEYLLLWEHCILLRKSVLSVVQWFTFSELNSRNTILLVAYFYTLYYTFDCVADYVTLPESPTAEQRAERT